VTTVHELTVMALTEAGHRPVVAALEALGPNRVGDPSVGMFGWLLPEERLALCKAVILAHGHAGTPDFGHDDPAELADWIRDGGAWRNPSKSREVMRAFVAYSAARRGFDLTGVTT
jgi:hypothetical protein